MDNRLNQNVKFRSYILGSIMAMTFLVQLFNNMIQSISIYLAILMVLTLIFLVSKRYVYIPSKVSITFTWMLALIGIIISYIPAARLISVWADIIVFICGFLVIASSGTDPLIFSKCIPVTKFFSTVYAVSLWIQLLLPRIYNFYLGILQDKDKTSILRLKEVEGALTGFSTNPGFIAGHIVAGICILLAFRNHRSRKKKILFSFLFLSLLLTAKRSTLVIMIVVVIFIYLVQANTGQDKMNRYLMLIGGGALLLILIVMLGDVLTLIPAVKRIVDSINGIILGEDITSNRLIYYGYAWELFNQNKLFGIGWGGFRQATLGVVTWVNTVEVHNIYLQMLVEMGVSGFVLMVFPIFLFWKSTFKAVRNLVKANSKGRWLNLLIFSLSYQTFFILQGTLENTLYDINYSLTYLISVAIFAAYSRSVKVRNRTLLT